jgi:methylmalonyl-CoA mutase N-terminal domain/subunit
MEREAYAYFDRIDEMGGMVEAIERGFPQREIADSAYRFQKSVESNEKIVVGVNDFIAAEEAPVPTLYIDENTGKRQVDRLEKIRRERDNDRVWRALDAVRAAAFGRDNLMPPLLDAVRAYATVGEMCDAMREVWGEYEEEPVI